MNNLSPQELELFKSFLSDYSDVLGNRGCNDLLLPNNEINRKLIREASIYSYGQEEYDKYYAEDELEWEKKDLFGKLEKKEIYTIDSIIFKYLCHKLGMDFD